jgi:hypothetical protein
MRSHVAARGRRRTPASIRRVSPKCSRFAVAKRGRRRSDFPGAGRARSRVHGGGEDDEDGAHTQSLTGEDRYHSGAGLQADGKETGGPCTGATPAPSDVGKSLAAGRARCAILRR